MHETRPFVLSIAGIDPSAGAGLLTDIKTLEQHDVAGLAVATCLTMQNHRSISDVKWFDIDTIQDQIDSLLSVYNVSVVKIGVVPHWEILNQVVNYLMNYNPGFRIIVDPIMVSSSGYRFCDAPGDDLRDEVLEKIFLLTPNQTEFEILFGNEEKTACNVLVKSLRNTDNGTDALIGPNGGIIYFYSQKRGYERHGSGCVLSAAIAANLTWGKSLERSIEDAKRYIEKYLTHSESLITSKV